MRPYYGKYGEQLLIIIFFLFYNNMCDCGWRRSSGNFLKRLGYCHFTRTWKTCFSGWRNVFPVWGFHNHIQAGPWALPFKVVPVFYLWHPYLQPGNEDTDPAPKVQQDNLQSLFELYVAMISWLRMSRTWRGHSLNFIPCRGILISLWPWLRFEQVSEREGRTQWSQPEHQCWTWSSNK